MTLPELKARHQERVETLVLKVFSMGLTREAAAKRLGVSVQYLPALENKFGRGKFKRRVLFSNIIPLLSEGELQSIIYYRDIKRLTNEKSLIAIGRSDIVESER